VDQVVGENLDRLASVEMRRIDEPIRNISRPIHDVIRDKQGQPATTMAAACLLDSLHEGDFAFFTTGAGTPPWMPKGEVDGPPGMATVARALYFGRRVLPVFVIADNHRDVVAGTLEGLGMNVLPRDMAATWYWPSAIVEVMPATARIGDAAAWTAELFNRYSPRAVIASEKLGPNEHGVTHTATGLKRSPEFEIDAAELFHAARNRGISTVSVGDVGNELGYGIVHDEVAAILEKAGVGDNCGCGGSIVSAVGCDVLIHGGNADWGAYALAAAIALLVRDTRVLPSTELHRRALDACVAAGAVGQFGHQIHVGGTGVETQLGFLTLMRQMVDIALAEHHTRPF
jgi:D-glutamate cyclase